MPCSTYIARVVAGDPCVDRMLGLNVNAVFRTVLPCSPNGRAKTGDILVTSSVAGLVPVVWEPITRLPSIRQAFVHTVRRQVSAWHPLGAMPGPSSRR